MPLKTPKFWYRDKESGAPVIETLLAPLSILYQCVHKINQSTKASYKSTIPVICVGNAVAGGSGKTPCCVALYNLLSERKDIHFLTRGYKGRISDAVMVETDKHSHLDVGDEPLLLARHASTIKSPDRPEGLRLAEAQKASLVIMDDGLQNNSVHKDISFTVIDGQSGLGNCKTLPAGPLREDMTATTYKTDAFILIGEDKTGIKNVLKTKKPVFTAKIEPETNKTDTKGAKAIAFAGLGRPEKFKNTLQTVGYDVIGWHEFPDHYNYTKSDLQKLEKLAKDNDAILITTEKDMLRISSDTIETPIHTLPITLVFDDPYALKDFIESSLK